MEFIENHPIELISLWLFMWFITVVYNKKFRANLADYKLAEANWIGGMLWPIYLSIRLGGFLSNKIANLEAPKIRITSPLRKAKKYEIAPGIPDPVALAVGMAKINLIQDGELNSDQTVLKSEKATLRVSYHIPTEFRQLSINDQLFNEYEICIDQQQELVKLVEQKKVELKEREEAERLAELRNRALDALEEFNEKSY